MPRITIHEPGKAPQPYRIDLKTNELKFGRGEDNDIIVACGSISTYHAALVRIPGGFELHDLGSTNGIEKNNQPVETCSLENGDSLSLGDVGLVFELSEEEIKTLEEETAPAPVKEDTRRPKHPPKTAQPHVIKRKNAIPEWCIFLAFVIFGTGAFFTGASLRYKNETGVSYGELIKKRLTTPDINRIKAITGENPDEVLLNRSTESSPTSPEIEQIATDEPDMDVFEDFIPGEKIDEEPERSDDPGDSHNHHAEEENEN